MKGTTKENRQDIVLQGTKGISAEKNSLLMPPIRKMGKTRQESGIP
jgi:hypothetical protein